MAAACIPHTRHTGRAPTGIGGYGSARCSWRLPWACSSSVATWVFSIEHRSRLDRLSRRIADAAPLRLYRVARGRTEWTTSEIRTPGRVVVYFARGTSGQKDARCRCELLIVTDGGSP